MPWDSAALREEIFSVERIEAARAPPCGGPAGYLQSGQGRSAGRAACAKHRRAARLGLVGQAVHVLEQVQRHHQPDRQPPPAHPKKPITISAKFYFSRETW